MPEEQDVLHVSESVHEEKIYDDLCSIKRSAGSQVHMLILFFFFYKNVLQSDLNTLSCTGLNKVCFLVIASLLNGIVRNGKWSCLVSYLLYFGLML